MADASVFPAAVRADILAKFAWLRETWPWLTAVSSTRTTLTLDGSSTSPSLPPLRFRVEAALADPPTGGGGGVRWRLLTPALRALAAGGDDDDEWPQRSEVLVAPTPAVDAVAVGLRECMLPPPVADGLAHIQRESPFFAELAAHSGGGQWTLRGRYCDIDTRVVVGYERLGPRDKAATPALLARNAANFSAPPRWRLLGEGHIDLLQPAVVVGVGAATMEPLLQRLFQHQGVFRQTDDRTMLVLDVYDHVAACNYGRSTRANPIACACPAALQHARQHAVDMMEAEMARVVDTMDIDVPDDLCEDEDAHGDIDLPTLAAPLYGGADAAVFF